MEVVQPLPLFYSRTTFLPSSDFKDSKLFIVGTSQEARGEATDVQERGQQILGVLCQQTTLSYFSWWSHGLKVR